MGLYQPVADALAVVRQGHARFTVLTPEMIRMEWSPDDHFEDAPSLVFLNRRLPVPAYRREEKSGVLTLRTDALTLHYAPAAGTDGRFTPDDLTVTLTLNGRIVVWKAGDTDKENLLGTARTLDGVRGDRTSLEPGLVSRAGWAVVDDSRRPLFDSADFQFAAGEKSVWPWAKQRDPGEGQDWYFLGYGHDYRKALGDFVRVAGRIPLPPRFAFGAWWSRYWAYSDQELVALAKNFRENDVPLDVLVIDMDWHLTFRDGETQSEVDQTGAPKGWTGYTWDRDLFPDPSALLAKLHAEGLKTTLNLHPASGVQPWEDAYPAMARAMGIDPATQKYIPFDITDERFAMNYMNILHHPLEKQGIDFWWLDWQDRDTTRLEGVNPTFWLNYVHFSDQEREGKRPLLFHRWGGLGNHRYQIGFSGDTVSVWESLQFQPRFTATAANVGYAYWSHDIGGHVPGAVDPELYLRWLQFGALSPILRTHTTKNPDAERRIWAYPEPYSDDMRAAFRLRYDLIPYIYTEARRTYDTGVAFVHPLYYDWPEAAEAYAFSGEYTFGDSLIVAPVTSPVDTATGLAKERVWLPPGDWVEWQSGLRFTGPVELQRSFDISEIPIYAKAGAIIPLAPKISYTGEKPLDPLKLRIFPSVPASGSDYTLYEDAGNDREYRAGRATYTHVHAAEHAGVLTITVSPAKGSYSGQLKQRALELQLPGDWPPRRVSVNGIAVPMEHSEGKPGWRFEGNTLTTIIPVGTHATTRPVIIRVERSAELVARRSDLNGFAGRMERLRLVREILQGNFPLDGPTHALIRVAQTGDRLTYYPDTASAELSRFSSLLQAETDSANAEANGLSPEKIKKYQAQFGERWQTPELQQRVAQTNDHLRRAAALLSDASGGGDK